MSFTTRTDLYGVDHNEPTGFIDPDNIGVAYDSTAKTITLTHASGTVDYYYRGVKYSKTSPWTSTAHDTANQAYWLWFDQAGVGQWGNFPGFMTGCIIANVYYGATHKFGMRECHGLMSWETWKHLHDTVGTYRLSGGAVTALSYALNTNTVDAVTPAVDSGVIVDEDFKTTVNALANGSTYTRLHVDSGSIVLTTGSTFPFPDDGTDIQYNQNPSSGTALTAIGTSNRWVNVYGILTQVTSEAGSQAYRILWMTGQAIYTSAAAAQAEDFRSLNLGNLLTIFPEFVPYIRLTYKRTSSNLTRNAQFDVNPGYLTGTKLGLVSVSGFVPTSASQVTAGTTNFNNNLSTADDTVQKALDTLDDARLNGQETNYITNPSAKFVITGWENTSGDFTLARSTTASELPRENTTATGIKIVGTGNTETNDFVHFNFTLDDVDANGRIMKLKWDQKVLASYAAGQLEVYISSQADRNTALATPFTTLIPAQDGTFQTYFLAPSTATLSLVIRATANLGTGDGICISDVVVGPNVQVQGSAIGNWKAYTPTVANVTTSSATGQWMEAGSNIHIRGTATFSAQPTGSVTVSLPSGFTANTTVIANSINSVVGVATFNDATANFHTGNAALASTATIGFHTENSAAQWNATNPVTAASGDVIAWTAIIPVNELSSNVTLANRAVEEYGADDGSAGVFGPNGALVPNQAVGTAVTRVFTLPSTAQQTDFSVLEFKLGTGNWQLAADVLPFAQQGTKDYGIRGYWSSTTQYTASFGAGGLYADSGTYAQNGSASWAALFASGARFRLRKTSGGASVGYPISGKNLLEERTIQVIVDTATVDSQATMLQYILNKGTAFTVTLGTAVGKDGVILKFKNIGAGVVTLDANASETIDGATTKALNQYDKAELIAYNGNWSVI